MTTPLLSVKHLTVAYSIRRNLFGKVLRSLEAVKNVSFDLYPGETLGIVGESGCGKSTLSKAIMQLLEPASGEIRYKEMLLGHLTTEQSMQLKREIQIVFQDPYGSLNPQMKVGEAIMEVAYVHHLAKGHEARKQMCLEILRKVGLSEAYFDRYPHQLSGGQRQRIGIARALILNPHLLVCDESVSALDVSVQAQVLNLFNALKQELGLSYIFISHDLSVVHYMCDRILVMKEGEIVEQGTIDQIFESPQHPYTQQLMQSYYARDTFRIQEDLPGAGK